MINACARKQRIVTECDISLTPQRLKFSSKLRTQTPPWHCLVGMHSIFSLPWAFFTSDANLTVFQIKLAVRFTAEKFRRKKFVASRYWPNCEEESLPNFFGAQSISWPNKGNLLSCDSVSSGVRIWHIKGSSECYLFILSPFVILFTNQISSITCSILSYLTSTLFFYTTFILTILALLVSAYFYPRQARKSCLPTLLTLRWTCRL